MDSRCSSWVAQRSRRLPKGIGRTPPSLSDLGRIGPRLPTKNPDTRRKHPSPYSPREIDRCGEAPTQAPSATEKAAVIAAAARKSPRKRRPPASMALRSRDFRRLARRRRCRRVPDLVGLHRPALERVMARRDVAVAKRVERRFLDVAMPLVEPGAARMEPAGARRVDRARYVAFEHDRLALAAELRVRNRHR